MSRRCDTRGGTKSHRGKQERLRGPARFSRPVADRDSGIVNYSADAGAGSNTIINISESPGWRAALLGTAAAGALWLGLPRHAKAGPDACDVSVAGVATCQGDQSGGISSAGTVPPNFDPATVTTLNVNELTTNIAPGAGVDGIYFQRTGALNTIVINSDTGPFDIIVNGASGIEAFADAAITITHTGDIDASAGRYGILATATTGGIDITSNGEIVGVLAGISARNFGLGAVAIDARGDVAARNIGVYARTTNLNSTSVSITTQGVTALYDGINAFNRGTGALTIVANGAVEATRDGVYGRNSNVASTDLSITTQSVTGGILGRNDGLGALSITANGDVFAGTSGIGIYARHSNAAATGPLTIVSEGATGGLIGISATNSGTGALKITAHGDVEGTGNIGIYAKNSAGADLEGTSLSIVAAGDVIGGNRGIDARNEGTGALTIVANGDVEGTEDTGVYLRNDNGTDIGVTTEGEVTGGGSGFFVRNFGTGALTIEANGNGDVIGGNRGIDARNYGSGALSVTAHGDVTGTANAGIYTKNHGVDLDGKSLSITSQGVTGGEIGIDARNYGAGALTIIANGDVTGTNVDGIFAQNFNAYSTALSVTSQGVTGGIYGIAAGNVGTGALTIVANGDVEGIISAGIEARNFKANGTGPLSITSEGVTGGFNGIDARSFGLGALTVNANGDVTGTTNTGILARLTNAAATGPLSITTEAVTGEIYGIRAVNYGTGGLTIVANGDVAATGAVSTGIVVQNNAGTAPVSITTHGKVTGGLRGIDALTFGGGVLTIVANDDVTGSNTGIRASPAGSAPASVTVGSGASVMGGTAGVVFQGGGNGTLTNFGRIANLSGVTGLAVASNIGSDTVNNFGVITGSVNLFTGANAFNNMAGGLFNSGTEVNLGEDNLLTNHGTLSPGGSGTILTTALTGNFAQPGSAIEVNLSGPNADRLDISGDAELAGDVRPLYTLNGLGSARRWTILTSGTPIVDNGIAPISTEVVTFDLIFPTATQMDLVLDSVDFALSGLNRNETAIANNLNAIFAAGNFASLDLMMTALAFLPNAGALAKALDQLSPEIYLDQEIATLFSSANFTSSLMTCPVRDGAAAYIKEGQCVWARLSGRDFDQDQTFQTLGFDETSFEVAGGLQGALGEVWRLGFAGAYEHGSLDTGETFATSEVDRAHAGAVLKYNPGALLLAAAVSGGWGWYDTERPIGFTGFSALPSSDNEIGYLNGRFRAEYLLSAGGWYAKPLVDFDATEISLEHVKESGAGGVGLNVRGNDQTVLSATPALELGAQFGGPAGTLVRPYIRGGATFFDDPDFVLLASFEGAPDGVGPFRIATKTDEVIGLVGAGLDVVGTDGASFRIYYEGRFSDLVEQHAGGIKASLPF